MEGQDILVIGALGFAAYYLYNQFASSSTTTTTPTTPGGTGNPLANTTINAPSGSNPTTNPTPKPPTLNPAVTTVQLINVSRPGQQGFVVGDAWKLSITGPPNSSVFATAIQNGKAVGTGENFGNTDANGQFSLTGVMDPSTQGLWQETWTVGNNPPAQISFTVTP